MTTEGCCPGKLHKPGCPVMRERRLATTAALAHKRREEIALKVLSGFAAGPADNFSNTAGPPEFAAASFEWADAFIAEADKEAK